MRFKKRKPKYRDGEHLIQSDLTGRTMYSSDSRKLWNGLICHKDEYEIRNPQDFIKAKPERKALKEVRPRNIQFLDKPITADDL